MTALLELFGAALLIVGNAAFVAAEFALVSARRSQIEPAAERGDRRARATLKAMEHVSVMLATTQLGVTVCSLLFAALAEPTLEHLLHTPLHAAGVPDVLIGPIGYAVGLVVAVSVHTILGEMVPKNLTLAGPEKVAVWLVPPLAAIARALGPVIAALNASARLVLRLFRIEMRAEVASELTVEELARLVEDAGVAGVLDEEERERLEDALELGRRPVTDVLLPAGDVVTVPAGVTPERLEKLAAETGYSRFPVRDDDGAVRGYLHVKDALEVELEGEDRTAAIPQRLWRSMPVLPAATSLEAALAAMRRTASHLGAVVGEDRRPLGLVTLEDVLEELVGPVSDPSHPDD